MEIIGWMAFFVGLYVAYRLDKLVRELKRKGVLDEGFK
jgi:hypothetical protein